MRRVLGRSAGRRLRLPRWTTAPRSRSPSASTGQPPAPPSTSPAPGRSGRPTSTRPPRSAAPSVLYVLPHPGRRGDPAERRLPEAARDRGPGRLVAVARATRRRGGRRQCRDVSQVTCNALFGALGAMRRGPGHHEQPHLRRRDLPVLRNHLRRRRRRPRIRRPGAGPDPHDQHPHDRPGGPGTALPRAARGVHHPPRLGRRRAWHGGDGAAGGSASSGR